MKVSPIHFIVYLMKGIIRKYNITIYHTYLALNSEILLFIKIYQWENSEYSYIHNINILWYLMSFLYHKMYSSRPTSIISLCKCVFYVEPNSSIHFSYFSRSSLDTDLLHFWRASRKSCLVTGMSSSSLARFLIWLGLSPAIFLLMLIMLASRHTLVMSAPL